ncbi:head GIN domain-containing protein [Pseudoduganella plicata]|uniref:DUF2807 domain-containing protein n=1 Tax=Pseudoduganella plicata TaxID=321984 RepID=A0A4P7BKN8_9BURK|nr:head GIN domain-containing protein [Pseudoduganella plicata]QBQ39040.1 DUF2807 domain-containing protein [Pseudoduganella plicata]GGY86716.1 hypothetical protein GCM10007388_20000 [Pseudoduganella plicata]
MHRSLLLACLCALATTAHAAEESRTLAPFRAIAVTGPIDLRVDAGKAQSVRISGSNEFLGRVRTIVKDGELRIDYPGKASKTTDGGRIVVTLPSLVKCMVEGAGEVDIDNLNEERVDLQFQGAGHLSAKGKTKWLRLKAQGVGHVDTKELKAERTDVNFEGIGEVSIHASQTLNAVVRGLGNVVYYGRPKTLNKSASGLGKISSGD